MNKKELIILLIGILLAICVGHFSHDLPPVINDRMQETNIETLK